MQWRVAPQILRRESSSGAYLLTIRRPFNRRSPRLTGTTTGGFVRTASRTSRLASNGSSSIHPHQPETIQPELLVADRDLGLSKTKQNASRDFPGGLFLRSANSYVRTIPPPRKIMRNRNSRMHAPTNATTISMTMLATAIPTRPANQPPPNAP